MKNLEINTLNINSNSLLNIATFRQEDNATLMLELYKNGQSIDLTGQKIILGAERSDGSIIEQEEDISTNENIVTIKLKKNILAVNGLVKMQLTLSDREGTMSTTSFNINVDRKILGAENIKASNDIETINSLVLDLKTNVNKAITDTKDKASTLLSGLEDTANSVELKVNALTDISNGLLKNLENQCKDSTIINTELSNNIQQALPVNTELKENIKIGQPLVQEATTKNTELQASLEKTKEFINGLDGSQNIPQLRLDVTELQNGLKSNQALAYQGSSISANDTLESRTEGMRIGGKTMYKKADGTYTDTWEEGVTLESFGEKEGNKISILSSGFLNRFNAKKLEEINYGEGFKLIDASTNTFQINSHRNYVDLLESMNMNLKNKTNITLSYTLKKISGLGVALFEAFYSDGEHEIVGIVSNGNFKKTLKKPLQKLIFTYSDFGVSELSNVMISEIDTPTFKSYKQDKKDILIKKPLRSKDDICDLLYEDNGQVKIDRYVGIRKYQEGDEKNKDVITDKINTVYILDKPVTEVVENCVDIDLDTFGEKTYFNILNSLPGTLDFKVPSNIASIVQNTAREVNNIWDVINNLLVPSIVKANGNLAMIKLNNNLN